MATPGALHVGQGASNVHTDAPTSTRAAHSSHDAHDATPVYTSAPVYDAPRQKEGTRVNSTARLGVLAGLAITTLGFLVFLGGLAAIQRRTKQLSPFTGVRGQAYVESMQSAGLQPYPASHSQQWGFQWYILAFEIVLCTIATLLLFTSHGLLRTRVVLMCLFTYLFTLTTLQIQSALYLRRSTTFFKTSYVRALLAGAIIGAIGNGLTIIALGLLKNKRAHNAGLGGGKRVGANAV